MWDHCATPSLNGRSCATGQTWAMRARQKLVKPPWQISQRHSGCQARGPSEILTGRLGAASVSVTDDWSHGEKLSISYMYSFIFLGGGAKPPVVWAARPVVPSLKGEHGGMLGMFWGKQRGRSAPNKAPFRGEAGFNYSNAPARPCRMCQ